MTKVAEQFEVSGSYMARVCSLLQVPRPERGYWAKLAVGKAPAQQPLPEALPGDQLFWSKDRAFHDNPALKPEVPKRPRKECRPRPISGSHALIRGAKAHFESGRPVEEGEYLKPYKKLIVDITASKAGLNKALAFTNDLFNALESAGYRVRLATQNDHLMRAEVDQHEKPLKRHEYYPRLWSPFHPTVVFVGTVAIGLAVVEMSEPVLMRHLNGAYIRDSEYIPPKASRRHIDHTWTTTRELPCGRLRLLAYSPYWRVSWSAMWQESKNASLVREIPSIVKGIDDAADSLVDLLKEADLQAEVARQKLIVEEENRRREEDRQRIQQSIKDSQAQLAQIIQAWADVMNLERFFQGVYDHAQALPPMNAIWYLNTSSSLASSRVRKTLWISSWHGKLPLSAISRCQPERLVIVLKSTRCKQVIEGMAHPAAQYLPRWNRPSQPSTNLWTAKNNLYGHRRFD
jgi:hypothetical protein